MCLRNVEAGSIGQVNLDRVHAIGTPSAFAPTRTIVQPLVGHDKPELKRIGHSSPSMGSSKPSTDADTDRRIAQCMAMSLLVSDGEPRLTGK